MDQRILPVIETLLRGEGLQAISDAAAAALGNPFWIVDLNSTHLTSLSGESGDETLIQEKEMGYVRDDTVDYLRESRIREKISRAEHPVLFPAPGTNRRILTCAVRIANIMVATVSTIEENHPFSEEDKERIGMIAEIVSTELQKDSFYRNNKTMMYSYFLTDLLENNLYHADMRNRLGKLGYQPKELFYLLTVELETLQNRDFILTNLQEQLKHILKDVIYCIYENRSVLLLTRSKPLAEDDFVLRRLRSFLETGNMKASISDVFRELSLVPEQYKKNAESLRLGKHSMPEECLYHYSALATQHVLQLVQGTVSWRDFCSGALEKLTEYDRQTGNALMESLLAYLENNSRIVPCAKQLDIHPNTLRYRLEKIREVTGCDLGNGHQCFDLMLGLKLHALDRER